MIRFGGLVVALASCGTTSDQQPAPAAVASVWAWSFEDQPYVVLHADGTLEHRGLEVGRLDLEDRTISLPPLVEEAPYEALGPVSRRGDAAWIQLMHPRLGLAADGSIRGLAQGGSADEERLLPWGRMEPADVPEAASTGLLWAALLLRPVQPVVATLTLPPADDGCPAEASVTASALGDGRIVSGPACATWYACDLGAPIGRWDPAGLVLGDASSPAALTAHVRQVGGVASITPIGESTPWLTVDESGVWSAARSVPGFTPLQPTLGSVIGFDSVKLDLSRPDAQAVALVVATGVARERRKAADACPPPPPPPPP